MKLLSLLLGVLGLVSLVLSFYGRFSGPSVVFLLGDSVSSAMLLQFAGVMFSMGVFVRVLATK
ncbi:MAG: hypothetical protein MUE60_00080 [Candidatus Eisenbacteria bacterium]|jgi:hypothetical protein|nr:hypothetical protein [Candidatus Eisenbacteria bacterium]